jgi:hypothetical protein
MSLTARRILGFAPWLKDPLWRKAQAVPSLDLRFADSKSLVDSVSGQNLITFTRASSATYINSTGTLQTAATNEPRFDHNPTTGESLGLLVEEQRTNLLLRSEAIATSPWFAGANTTLSNNTGEVLDPAGGLTATKVLVSGGTGAFGQGATLTAAIYTGSIWLRCSTGTISASLIIYLSVSPFTSIGTTSVTITTSWQRFTVVSSTATAVAYNLQLNAIAVGTVYAWGAQLEAGAFATSYIPTTTAAATRAADVATITGAAFSSWYRQDEGTIYTDHLSRTGATGTTQVIVNLNNSGSDQQFIHVVGASVLASNAFVANVSQGRLDSVTPVANTIYRAAVNYGQSSRNLSVNGLTYGPNTGSTPTNTQMAIGQNGGSALNGTIRRLTYWPSRLPNTTLQRITQ